jgi:hypothetical protein
VKRYKVLNPAYKIKHHIHTNYQKGYNRKCANSQAQPIQKLWRIGAEPDNNSVGPELTQERANEHRHYRQNSSIAGNTTRGWPLPGNDQRCLWTNKQHQGSSKREEATKQALPKRRHPEIPHLSHTTIEKLRVVSSKTVFSRRVRRESTATTRSEDLGFSPGADGSLSIVQYPLWLRSLLILCS